MSEKITKTSGQMAEDWSRSFEHALAGVARQQTQRDSQRSLLDEALSTASLQIEELFGETPAHLRVLPAAKETGDRLAETTARDFEPARARIARESDSPLARNYGEPLHGRLATVASEDMRIEPRRQFTKALAQTLARSENDSQARLGLDDPVTQLARNYREPVPGQPETVGSEDTGIEPGGQFTKAFAETLARRATRSQARGALDEQTLPFSKAALDNLYQYYQSSEPGWHAARAQTIADNVSRTGEAGVSASGSVLGGLSDIFDQRGPRSGSTDAGTTPDRDSGWNRDDGRSSAPVGNDSAHEAMAVAASELERLRLTVKRTIDDLERVRGSVHPPLPALPVNRGSYRIS
jgi:hypothetical protein